MYASIIANVISSILTKVSKDVTGRPNAKKAIIDVYDVFGFAPQTLQGADRLAAHIDVLVLVPDFFEGEPLPLDAIPPDTDEKKQVMQTFLTKKADFAKNVPALLEIAKIAKERYSGVTSWGAFGLCWGGKVSIP